MKKFYSEQNWVLFISLALSLGFAGCVSDTQTLVRVQDEPAGANCVHGGYAVHSGSDENDNGVLDSSEDAGLAYICHSGPSLVRQHSESAGVNCASGGVAVETGADLNGNGILEDNEVIKTHYVCNGYVGGSGSIGEDGALTVALDEPAGVHCLLGGIALKSGHDANSNSVLDESEVKSTTYICNGLNGTKEGYDSLTRIEAEAPGVNCQYGGAAVLSGLDLDNSKTLEDSEILNTAYICESTPKIYYGDYEVLYEESALDAAKQYGEITGRLKLWYLPAQLQVGLPFLRSVGGIDFSSLYTDLDIPFSFPYLTNVRENFSFTSNASVKTLNSFPALKRIGGSAIFWDNKSLLSLEGFNPEEVGATFSVAHHPVLAIADVTALKQSDRFYLGDLPMLNHVSFYHLTKVPSFMSIARCPSVTEVSFPSLSELGTLAIEGTPLSFTGFSALRSINGLLYTYNNPAGFSFNGLQKVTRIGGLMVKNNPELTSLAGLEGLREINGDLTIMANARLSDISALRNVRFINGNVTIYQNAIKTCTLSAWLNQLMAGGATITGTISVTGISGTCP